MRTCLIFMVIGWVALVAGYAASEQSPAENPAKTSSDHARDAEKPASAGNRNRQTAPSTGTPVHRRAVEKNYVRSHTSLAKATRPKQPSSGEHSRSVSAMELHQPRLNRSGGATKEGVIHNETLNRTLPVRPPSVPRTNTPSLNNVRHRGPNPAVIGGPRSSNTSNTAAINGTHLGRRP